MPATEEVKRALADLARRRPSGRRVVDRVFGTGGGYRETIRQGNDAIEDLTSAAAFREAGGLERLAAAVDEAEAAGDHAAARRGRRALRAFERFREAARHSDDEDDRDRSRSPGSVDDRAARGTSDHFHRGRGTPLGGGDEGGE